MRNGLLGLCLAMWAGVANADSMTIDAAVDFPDVGKYVLVGQSAFVETRTGSSTSGGQLDNVESGVTSITFTELSPPPALSDYLGFAYFGIIETHDGSGDVIDTSLVIAYAPGSGVGETASNTFPYTEAELVTAFTTSVDSPEFLNMLDLVPANATTLGDIAVPPIAQPGTTLDLVAFIGGPDGDLGVKVGTLAVTVVPEPSTVALAAAGALGLSFLSRRRSFR